MPPNYTWLDLITKAFSMGIELTAHDWLYPSEIPTPFQCKSKKLKLKIKQTTNSNLTIFKITFMELVFPKLLLMY